MGRAREKLTSGDFNNYVSEEQHGDTVIITLSKRSDNRLYRFQVRNLYQEDEEVLSEEIIET